MLSVFSHTAVTTVRVKTHIFKVKAKSLQS